MPILKLGRFASDYKKKGNKQEVIIEDQAIKIWVAATSDPRYVSGLPSLACNPKNKVLDYIFAEALPAKWRNVISFQMDHTRYTEDQYDRFFSHGDKITNGLVLLYAIRGSLTALKDPKFKMYPVVKLNFKLSDEDFKLSNLATHEALLSGNFFRYRKEFFEDFHLCMPCFQEKILNDASGNEFLLVVKYIKQALPGKDVKYTSSVVEWLCVSQVVDYMPYISTHAHYGGNLLPEFGDLLNFSSTLRND